MNPLADDDAFQLAVARYSIDTIYGVDIEARRVPPAQHAGAKDPDRWSTGI